MFKVKFSKSIDNLVNKSSKIFIVHQLVLKGRRQPRILDGFHFLDQRFPTFQRDDEPLKTKWKFSPVFLYSWRENLFQKDEGQFDVG